MQHDAASMGHDQREHLVEEQVAKRRVVQVPRRPERHLLAADAQGEQVTKFEDEPVFVVSNPKPRVLVFLRMERLQPLRGVR
jgi:hypothetical protein